MTPTALEVPQRFKAEDKVRSGAQVGRLTT